ncbi:MAG: Asp-tRNA(Asn)/Glu-tRNA(Gln) amidotransferase GatCAB subunit B [Waddliaceae bacterium]|nr:Asp-tRNA(Asn)/Glu-tRNA(Gln) amidotransferase GatCAB subunit B [Waddliaceae bacterium]
MADLLKEWEPVIGLEIHTELNTKSKLFSVAPNRFGDEPNTNITEVCTGQPGALPVLNKEVVRKAVQFGCAVGAEVAHFSKFDRKSYFYPDSPRNFQITQLDEPIVLGGKIITDVGNEEKEFAIDRAHIEDDAGMLKHFSKFAGVDYNRAGVPLIEIVSEACMHSPQEAGAYARAVRAILQYLDVSDCNMEEGSLRFDANISVRKRGETGLRPKIEIKNMNSFTFMEMALTAEIQRQIEEYLANPDKPFHEVIQQATYRWDPELKKTVLMRSKEDAEDYRYFPEPDLPPIILEANYIEGVRATLPELPRERKIRYKEEYELKEEQAFLLTADKNLADYFEAGMKECSNARSLCNWITVEFAGRFRESGKNVWESDIQAIHIAHLITMIEDKTITGKIAKKVADDMAANPGKDPREIVAENPDYQPVHDEGELVKYVEQVLSENPDAITDFKAGKDRAFKFLMGQVMKLSRGKASPQRVTELLKERLES